MRPQSPPRQIPHDIRLRLNKLFPMLSSDKAGERDAAVMAMTRALKGAGFDWHDYTAAMNGASAPHSAPQQRPRPRAGSGKQTKEVIIVPSRIAIQLFDAIVAGHSGLLRADFIFLGNRAQRAKRYRNISFSVREMNLVLKLAQQARLFTLP